MKLMFHPPSTMVDVSSDRAGLARLASLVASGGGTLAAEEAASPYGEIALTRAEVRTTDGLVLLAGDAETRTLTISGAPEHLSALAGILEDMAASTDGGHVHIEHYPDHPYLGEGSAPMIVNSPLGGMPHR
ncbi:Imm32 family immunity protein [Spirillospora sp. CA-255316]